MKGPTSRWMRSEVTFGPVGRVVWTILLISPLLFAIFYSVFFVVAAGIWTVFMWVGLRDVWRKVKRPGHGGPVDFPQEPKPPGPGESLHDRKLPQRW